MRAILLLGYPTPIGIEKSSGGTLWARLSAHWNFLNARVRQGDVDLVPGSGSPPAAGRVSAMSDVKTAWRGGRSLVALRRPNTRSYAPGSPATGSNHSGGITKFFV